LIARGWRLKPARPPQDIQIPQSAAARAIMEGRMSAVRDYDIYVLSDGGSQGVEVVLPHDQNSIDFVYQVWGALRTLSNIEDREPKDIASAVRLIGFDVVRSRIPNAMVLDDSIHLEIAANYINAARDLLAATATTELEPEPYFLRVKPSATEYASHCRFGHTFKGSFGFLLESPLRPKQQAMFKEYEEPAPFERLVIQRLARGVQAVCKAVDSNDEKWLVDDVKLGFSANACEQFANLIEKTSSGGLDISFAFSPEWTTPEDLVSRQDFRVGARHIEASRSAAKTLRSNPISRSEKIVGRVIRLESRVDPSDLLNPKGTRQIIVEWPSADLGVIPVRIALLAPDYLRAVEAHRAGKQVVVSGTLKQAGQRFVLEDPTDFDIVE
jgi:hypothetical protein